MKILARNKTDPNWNLVNTANYENEKDLQLFLTESPEIISISEVRENAGSLVLAIREFSLPVGFIDVLAFTAGGDITLIECKLASNAEIKRKVIGQVLEYGAHLWKLSYIDLDQGVRLRLGESLVEAVGRRVNSPDWDVETFRNNVETTLENGNFILVIVVDEINDELNRVVRFMNIGGSQGFDFAALEMRRFQSENTEVLIPRFFGPTHKPASSIRSSTGRQWTEEEFFSELTRLHGKGDAQVAKQILDWNKKKGIRIWWGKGKQSGSFVPCLPHNTTDHQLFAVWTYGVVEIYFYWFAFKPPFTTEAKRMELLEKLNQINGVSLSPEMINKRPSISLAVLTGEGKTEQFLRIIDWMVEEIKKS